MKLSALSHDAADSGFILLFLSPYLTLGAWSIFLIQSFLRSLASFVLTYLCSLSYRIFLPPLIIISISSIRFCKIKVAYLYLGKQ